MMGSIAKWWREGGAASADCGMRRAAFTLLELVLAMTIVGLALALVAPRFAALRDGASVRGAAGELGAAFSAARQMAITRRTTVSIVLDTAAGAIEIRSGGQPIFRRALR